MEVNGFVWSEEVIDKLAWKHQVQVEEVVELFANKPLFERLQRGRHRGEDLYVATGQTDAGRYLAVFFIRKQTGQALIVTARDLTAKERRQYAKR
jgi:uncharacterized DUF497 family protein